MQFSGHCTKIFQKIFFNIFNFSKININYKNSSKKSTFQKFFFIFFSNYIKISLLILPKIISPNISVHIKNHNFPSFFFSISFFSLYLVIFIYIFLLSVNFIFFSFFLFFKLFFSYFLK